LSRHRLAVAFAGGGTGGHLYPALSIAEAVRKRQPEADILFIGTEGKIEARVVPSHGFAFRSIAITGFARKLSLETLVFPARVVAAVATSIGILRSFKPDVVVGTGGYVCGPPLAAGMMLGIPTLIQEQNGYPGVTTRLLATRANEVHLTFESSRRYLKRTDNVFVTGNPTRAAIGSVSRAAGAAAFGLDPARTTVLVVGGSQGATPLNVVLQRSIGLMTAEGAQVLWGCGTRDAEACRRAVAALPGADAARVRVVPYIEQMENAYAACDLAISRSGASTLAELMCAGVPSVLVPYPYAAADHQTENARVMAEAGAAVLIPEARADADLMGAVLALLREPGQRQAMSARARNLGRPEAADTLAGAVLKLAQH
jgi:UDP-N-acetylglucosamine--N-acetylmuramyl-(pentapeptide) pyrophosphoryl-undecaprenol N-acetylglucosamine transferase